MGLTSTDARPTRYQITEAEAEQRELLWSYVAQIRGGPVVSADPFGDLYRATRATVFRFVRSRVGDHGTAEDLTSDTFERAYKRIGRLERASGSPAAWLVTIARNLVADHHKSARIRTTLVVDDVAPRTPEGRPEWTEAEDGTADEVLTLHDTIALLGAVTRLTDDQREAVRLRYLMGLSVAETGAELGKLDGAVKALTYRAVRTLARDPQVAALASAWLRPAA